jgi:class 3 adenylate cyclase/HAMP domain-containing protein
VTTAPPGERSASPSRWRRPRRLRGQLARALIATSAIAVLAFGALNFVAARDLLVAGTEQQLAAVGATRASSITEGAARLVGEISVAASDVALAEFLEGFAREFAALEDETLTPDEMAELEAFYQERVVAPANDAGLGPIELDDVLPGTEAARWLQYHYTVRGDGEPPPVDAGDGTGYSALNARFTAPARAFAERKGVGDILLIDENATIVYSLEKRNDVGTNLVDGPYADGALADVATIGLPRARVGTTLLTDYAVSATGRAALYAVTPLSNGVAIVGGLAVEIPVGLLNDVTSANGDWEGIGLDEGDSYIVGVDGRLQSEPRAWIDDPQGYLDRLRSGDEDEQAVADLIEFVGSPVGIQTIDTEPVRAAIEGQEFVGGSADVDGDPTFAAAQSFDASGQQWVVVTEVPRSVVLAPLRHYLLQIAIVLAIVLPLVAALGWYLSRQLTRPIRPTVLAAESIVDGERDPEVDTARGDEFGDLGRRLAAMAASLAAHEAELAAEYEHKRQLLLAVLPPSLVDDDGNIVGSGSSIHPGTVVAVTVAPTLEHEDPELLEQALPRAAELAETAAHNAGLDRIRVAADRYLFLARGGDADAGGSRALDFVAQFGDMLESDGGDVELELHVGLSSGPVATGLLATGALTFGAWGDPVRRALALASLSTPGQVLVDASTATDCAGSGWRLEPAHGVVDLDDEPMELFTLTPGQLSNARAASVKTASPRSGS